MKKAFQTLLVLAASAFLISCGNETQANPAAPASQIQAPSATEQAMINDALAQANTIRAENGLPLLQFDSQIFSAAQAHALDMFNRNYFEHSTPEGKSPFDRMHDQGVRFGYAAENIAHGQRTAVDVFRSWLNSPGHRQNLLNPRYHRHGIGWVNGYWVHDFAD